MRLRTLYLTTSALVLFFFSISPADAHVRKGTWLLQGTASFRSSSGDLYGDSETEFVLAPAVHYFVVNKFAIGGKVNVAMLDQGDYSRTSLFVGPSAQYYFARDMDAVVNPYLGAAVLLRSISWETTVGNTTYKYNASGSSIQLSAGLAWSLREHLALTPELSFNLESLEGTSGTTILIGIGLAGFLY